MKIESIDRLIFLHNFRNKRKKKPIQLTKTCEGYMLYRDNKKGREYIAVGLKKQQLQYFLQGLTYEYSNEITQL